jgi:spermidine/putrescine transport system permease protein
MPASARILQAYTWAFVAFMLAPLVLMVVASVNDVSPPSAFDWRGFTTKWHRWLWMPEAEARADPVLRTIDRGRLIGCLRNSAIVAGAVAPLSLVLGLSGAVLLTRWRARASGALWWVLLSPMLAPGVVLGLSTLIFWRQLGVSAGLATIILAQTTFVAGYPLLIVMARLQRQPPDQEEAALDLGASPFFVFRRVTLPFLAPALASAAVIATLASVENYNTTMFSKGGACTFATEIGAMSRLATGHPPVIYAIGAAIIVVTVAAAAAWTFALRAEARR